MIACLNLEELLALGWVALLSVVDVVQVTLRHSEDRAELHPLLHLTTHTHQLLNCWRCCGHQEAWGRDGSSNHYSDICSTMYSVRSRQEHLGDLQAGCINNVTTLWSHQHRPQAVFTFWPFSCGCDLVSSSIGCLALGQCSNNALNISAPRFTIMWKAYHGNSWWVGLHANLITPVVIYILVASFPGSPLSEQRVFLARIARMVESLGKRLHFGTAKG